MVTGLMEMNHFWLQVEITANRSQSCLVLIHGTVAFAPRRPHLSLRPEKTICGFDHVWFSSASIFPFLVNPSHLDKVGFLPHRLYSVIPCSETFQGFLLISGEYKISIAFKTLHSQKSILLSKYPVILFSSSSQDEGYSFTQEHLVLAMKPYFCTLVLM